MYAHIYEQVSMSKAAVKPPSINVHHKKWVRQLESETAAQKLEEHLKAVQEAAKTKNVGDFSEKLRAAILNEDDTSFWKAAHRPGGCASAEEQCESGIPSKVPYMQRVDWLTFSHVNIYVNRRSSTTILTQMYERDTRTSTQTDSYVHTHI